MVNEWPLWNCHQLEGDYVVQILSNRWSVMAVGMERSGQIHGIFGWQNKLDTAWGIVMLAGVAKYQGQYPDSFHRQMNGWGSITWKREPEE